MTPNQQRFVEEYLVDLNAKQAAIRAGYSAKTAEFQGSRLLSNAKVQTAIAAGKAKRSKKVEVTAEWVLRRLIRNHAKAAQAKPVLDREGNETGVYAYQGQVVNRALELIGKHLGMFVDRVETLERVKLEIVEEIVDSNEDRPKADQAAPRSIGVSP